MLKARIVAELDVDLELNELIDDCAAENMAVSIVLDLIRFSGPNASVGRHT